jgi:hypothetical protein
MPVNRQGATMDATSIQVNGGSAGRLNPAYMPV